MGSVHGGDGDDAQASHQPSVDLGHGVGQVRVIGHCGVDAADDDQVQEGGEKLR